MKIYNQPALMALGMVLFFAFAGAAQAKGDMVAYVEPKSALNAPPSVPLNSFQHFDLKPIAMGAPFEGQPTNEAARQSLQANLDKESQALLAGWNSKPTDGPQRTLVMEPSVRQIKFINGKTRFWAGGFAGGSAILITVRMTDSASGEVIAEPEFYQHASGIAGAWTFGSTDKAMLIRIATMVTEYLQNNYAQAVGGPTSVSPVHKP